MKHLLTAIACCLAVAGSAQFPYNPDSDGDNQIGMDDFLDFLPFFGSEFVVDTALIQNCEPEICGCSDCYIQEGKKLVFTTMSDVYLPEGDGFMVVSIVQNYIAQNSFWRVHYTNCWPPDDPNCNPSPNFHTYDNGKVMAQYVRNTQGWWHSY